MKLSARFGAMMMLALLSMNPCSSKENDASGAPVREGATYCYRQVLKSPTYTSKQISFRKSDNCETYDGEYVTYISEDRIAEKFVAWWSRDGKKLISDFAKNKGKAGLSGAIHDDLVPFLIVLDPNSIGEPVEVNFASSGFNYTVLLRPSDFGPVDVKVWQEE